MQVCNPYEEWKSLNKAEAKYVKVDSARRYEHHTVSSIQPKMNVSDKQELKNSIKQYGVLEPIILYDDKIVDGRHRQEVCIELELPMPVLSLQGNYTIEELRRMVELIHINKNLSEIQKQIQAYNYKCSIKNVTWEEAANKFGVKVPSIRRINALYNLLYQYDALHLFDSIIDELFKGNKLVHCKKYFFIKKPTASVTSIMKQYKEYIEEQANYIANDIDSTKERINPVTGEVAELKKLNNIDMIEVSKDDFNTLLQDIKEIKEENKKLREENKELKDKLDTILQINPELDEIV